MIIRFGFLAVLVTAAAAALYEYEDGGSPFDWLHSILTGMSVAVATAASILTVCGLRACTNGALRDSLAKCGANARNCVNAAKCLSRGKRAKWSSCQGKYTTNPPTLHLSQGW